MKCVYFSEECLPGSPDRFHSSFVLMGDYCSSILTAFKHLFYFHSRSAYYSVIFQSGHPITSPPFLEPFQCFLISLRINSKRGQSSVWYTTTHQSSIIVNQLPPFTLWSSDIGLVMVSQFYTEILLILFPLSGKEVLPLPLISQADSSPQFIYDFLRESLPNFPDRWFSSIMCAVTTVYLHILVWLSFYICVILWLMSVSLPLVWKLLQRRNHVSFLFIIVYLLRRWWINIY